MSEKAGVQPGSVARVTRTSPGWRREASRGLARMRVIMFAAMFVVNACLAYDGYKEAQAINGKQAVA